MELKEFIKTAIADIVGAVSELQEELAGRGATVNPALPHPADSTIGIGGFNRPVQDLGFDVALTTSESTSVDWSAKGGVAIFAARMESGQQAQTHNVSRLTFSIPVVLPIDEVRTDGEVARERENLGKMKPTTRDCQSPPD